MRHPGDGEDEALAAREPWLRQPHPLAQRRQIARHLSVVEGVQLHVDHVRPPHHAPGQPEEGGQPLLCGLTIVRWKILIPRVHRQVRQRRLADRHHLVLAVVQFVHRALARGKIGELAQELALLACKTSD